jgi:hypothetical protein
MNKKIKFPPLLRKPKAGSVAFSIYQLHADIISAMMEKDIVKYDSRSKVVQYALEEFAIQMGIEIPDNG